MKKISPIFTDTHETRTFAKKTTSLTLALILNLTFAFTLKAQEQAAKNTEQKQTQPFDYNKASIDELLVKAQTGDVLAICFLGYQYETGEIVKKDYVKALEYYRDALAKGNKDANFYIGSAYRAGRGVDKNYATALPYLEKAAQNGHAEAMAEIGLIYMSGGNGIAEDDAKAVEWMQKAADLGSDKAKHVLPALKALKASSDLRSATSEMHDAGISVSATNAQVANDNASLSKKENREALTTELLALQVATVNEAQKKAVEKMPELGVEDSIENLIFRGMFTFAERNFDEILKNPNWPLRFAAQIVALEPDIKERLKNGSYDAQSAFTICKGQTEVNLKKILGPPDSTYEDGTQWVYREAIYDPITERKASMWLHFYLNCVTSYKTTN